MSVTAYSVCTCDPQGQSTDNSLERCNPQTVQTKDTDRTAYNGLDSDRHWFESMMGDAHAVKEESRDCNNEAGSADNCPQTEINALNVGRHDLEESLISFQPNLNFLSGSNVKSAPLTSSTSVGQSSASPVYKNATTAVSQVAQAVSSSLATQSLQAVNGQLLSITIPGLPQMAMSINTGAQGRQMINLRSEDTSFEQWLIDHQSDIEEGVARLTGNATKLSIGKQPYYSVQSTQV